jgi:Holliday junction resolvasome RuvABC ATP-dependent DNA helicase subunit
VLDAFQELKKVDSNFAVSSKKEIDEILKELDSLIGLAEIKKLVREIHAFVEIQKRREKEQLATEPIVLHMIFKGNPGTGKTTVARIFGKVFREIGVLSSGHLIEVERADLVGEYIGHTAQKTRDQLKRAYGGILFIDEAYSLARGGTKDFGKESIDVLVKAMEDHKNDLILILAGYQNEMESFLEVSFPSGIIATTLSIRLSPFVIIFAIAFRSAHIPKVDAVSMQTPTYTLPALVNIAAATPPARPKGRCTRSRPARYRGDTLTPVRTNQARAAPPAGRIASVQYCACVRIGAR